MSWRTHLAKRWGNRKLTSIGAEEISRWREEMLATHGARTVLSALQILGALFRHARQFRWIGYKPVDDVRRPRYRPTVRAFTSAEIARLPEAADSETALLIRAAASTGLRMGELAGLRWSSVDLSAGTVTIKEQFTAGAWSETKNEEGGRQRA